MNKVHGSLVRFYEWEYQIFLFMTRAPLEIIVVGIFMFRYSRKSGIMNNLHD